MCKDPNFSKFVKTQGNSIEHYSLKILDNSVQTFAETSHQLEMICLN
jgi:hypothetical protein